jgi:hypothetical protein
MATLTLGTKNLTFVVEARIEESWETVSFPVYRDKSIVRSMPTLKRIRAFVRRKYHPDSPLHAALEGSAATLEFDSDGETHEFSGARVVEWEVYGELGGEMMEEVEMACEEEVAS